MNLSDKQVISIHQATARINIWEGAVRSGKTIASLLRWLAFIADAPTAGELLMMGRTRETIYRNAIAVLQNPDLMGELATATTYTPGAPTANILGRTIHVLGANDVASETKIRGMTVAGAYVDEATVIPEVTWQQLVARMSVTGAKLFATTNPDSPAHWLKRDWLDRNDPDLRSWHFTLDDNGALDPDYVAYLKRQYTGLWYRRFILGLWVIAEGAVYDMFDLQTHVVPAASVPFITDWTVVGIDYGTTNPFHAVLLGVGLDKRMYAVAEYRYDSRRTHRQCTDTEYSTALRLWLTRVRIPGTELCGVQPRYIVVDPSATSFRVQLHRDGVSPWPADNDVADGLRLVSSLLTCGQLAISQDCPELIGELAGYSWDAAAQAKGEDKPMKVNDHGADALRYGLKTTEGVWRNLLAPA